MHTLQKDDPECEEQERGDISSLPTPSFHTLTHTAGATHLQKLQGCDSSKSEFPSHLISRESGFKTDHQAPDRQVLWLYPDFLVLSQWFSFAWGVSSQVPVRSWAEMSPSSLTLQILLPLFIVSVFLGFFFLAINLQKTRGACLQCPTSEVCC
jgi:hypothetical protein